MRTAEEMRQEVSVYNKTIYTKLLCDVTDIIETAAKNGKNTVVLKLGGIKIEHITILENELLSKGYTFSVDKNKPLEMNICWDWVSIGLGIYCVVV